MFSKVFKGAPLGNKNAADKHHSGGSVPDHGIMRFRAKDPNGNIRQVSVGVNSSGKYFSEVHGVQSSGATTSLSSSSVMSGRSDLKGTAAKEKAFSEGVKEAYSNSKGDPKKVLSHLNSGTSMAWSSHEHVKPTSKKGESMFSQVLKANPHGYNQYKKVSSAAMDASTKANSSGTKTDHKAAASAHQKAVVEANRAGLKGDANRHAALARGHLSKVSKWESVFKANPQGINQYTVGSGKSKTSNPDDELVSVGDSWMGGDGTKEKLHSIPKPPKDLSKKEEEAFGSPAQHGLVTKGCSPAPKKKAKETKKYDRPVTGWSGDLGLGGFRK